MDFLSENVAFEQILMQSKETFVYKVGYDGVGCGMGWDGMGCCTCVMYCIESFVSFTVLGSE